MPSAWVDIMGCDSELNWSHHRSSCSSCLERVRANAGRDQTFTKNTSTRGVECKTAVMNSMHVYKIKTHSKENCTEQHYEFQSIESTDSTADCCRCGEKR
ncbi:hypothetical protein ABVT39_014117 [Epinephelus coioides]